MNGKELNYCSLCHRNGEAESLFRNHNLKTPDGRVVTCPVLRNYRCTLCGATKDTAHTLKYCPLNADGAHNRGASLSELKKKRNAAGSYSGRGVMLCQPLPREVSDQAEHPTVARIRRLEEEAARLKADYWRQQSYVAIRTFPSLPRNTFSSTVSPPDSPPRHHHHHTSATAEDFYNGVAKPQLDAAWGHGKENYNLQDRKENCFKDKGGNNFQNDYWVNKLAGSGWLGEDVGKLLAELRQGTSEV